MKIIQIINNLGSGGAEKLISDFVPLMREKDHNIEVLLLQKKGSIYIDDLEQKDIKVTCLTQDNLYSLKHILNIRKFIRKRSFDIVNVHLFPSLYFIALASILGLGTTKLIFTEHSTNNRRRENILLKIIDRFIYKRYNKVIAITDEVKNKLDKHLGNNKAFSEVINNGVDIDKFKNAQSIDLSMVYKNYNSSHKVICMVGRFSEAKDHATLIKALLKTPNDVNLLLIGEGPLQKDKKSLVNNLKLHDRVHFLGLRKDVPEILKACDIGVLSSHWEGFGLSAVEVMAAGKPVIVSNVEGLRDVVGDKDLLFEKGNSDELSQKINHLFANEVYYYDKAEYCLNRSKEFGINKMVDGYLKLYEKVINNKA